MLALLFCYLLITSSAFDCDLGPSDVIFAVKAAHSVSHDDFHNMKSFIIAFADSLDFGRASTQSRVGVLIYDLISDPAYRIPLDVYGRKSDFKTAVERLATIPCGYSWCKEDGSRTNQQVVDLAINQFPNRYGGRLKKVVVIQVGKSNPTDQYHYQAKMGTDPLLRISEIVIDDGVVTYDEPYYNYYQAFYDPYRRYASRMQQLYPNVSVNIPNNPYSTSHPKTINMYNIQLADSEYLCTSKRDLCNILFSCPPCGVLPSPPSASPTEISASEDEVPAQAPPTNSVSQSEAKPTPPPRLAENLSGNPTASKNSNDYEYEITGDPPGLKVDKTPLRDDPKKAPVPTTTRVPDYEYEDGSTAFLGSSGAVFASRDIEVERTSTTEAPFDVNSSLFDPSRKKSRKTRSVEKASASKERTKRAQQSSYRQSQCVCPSTSSDQISSSPSLPSSGCSSSLPSAYQEGCGGSGRSSCQGSSCQYYQQYYEHYYGYQQPVYQAIPQQYSTAEQISNRLTVPDPAPAGPKNLKTSGISDFSSSGTSGISKSKEAQDIFESLEKSSKYSETSDTVIEVPGSKEGDGRSYREVTLNQIPQQHPHILSDSRRQSPPRIDRFLEKFRNIFHLNPQITEAPMTELQFKQPDAGSALTTVEDSVVEKSVDLDSIRKRHRRNRRSPFPGMMIPFNNQHSLTPMALAAPPTLQMTPLQLPPLHQIMQQAIVPIGPQICRITGMDIVAYIDDTTDMAELHLQQSSAVVQQLLGLLENDVHKCAEVSRLGVIKSKPNGSLQVIQDLALFTSESLSSIASMQRTPCVRGIKSCDMALPDAIVMGSNMLTVKSNDRLKVIFILSSREASKSSKLSSVDKSIIDAMDYAENENIRIFNVAMKAYSSTKEWLASGDVAPTLCRLSPTPAEIQNKRKFCPWLPYPLIDRTTQGTKQLGGR